MFAGLRTLPLADAYALSYISPVIVAALSRFAFAERLHRRQWLALVSGFVGVLVVMRPAFVHAGGAIVFPMLMATSYAAYQVLTRAARRTDSAIACVFYASLVGATLLTLALPFIWRPMPSAYWGWFMVMGGFGLAGHWLLAVAANRAPPSLLAPLSYAQLAYAALVDLAVFGMIPIPALVGSAIILLAGVSLVRDATVSGAASGRRPGR
jgi:drug/metabolite transporter (DMT)-like permease